MRTLRTIQETREACRGLERELGYVPTMGALHEGHLSLVRAARTRCRSVAASVFVNPTQFGPSEDYDAYPRDEAGDSALLEREGVDLLFIPAPAEMYPDGHCTTVHVESSLTGMFEGASRPGHFDGVTTVVAKLLGIVGPDVLYLGRKDAQQLAVLRRMTCDLDLPVEVCGGATVREPDGLAMSSRNARLTAAERRLAPQLYAALVAARDALRGGGACDAAVSAALHVLDGAAAQPAQAPGGPRLDVDYIAVVDPQTFAACGGSVVPRHALIVGAARLGRVRLIDNVRFGDDADG